MINFMHLNTWKQVSTVLQYICSIKGNKWSKGVYPSLQCSPIFPPLSGWFYDPGLPTNPSSHLLPLHGPKVRQQTQRQPHCPPRASRRLQQPARLNGQAQRVGQVGELGTGGPPSRRAARPPQKVGGEQAGPAVHRPAGGGRGSKGNVPIFTLVLNSERRIMSF